MDVMRRAAAALPAGVWAKARAWLPWFAVLGLLAVLVVSVHPAALLAALRPARLWLLAPVLGCSLLAMLLRAIRWHLLLPAIDAPNTLGDSLVLFTAAQAALLVPGGLLLLPVLQRSQYGTPVRRSTPTVALHDLTLALLVLPAALPAIPAYHPAGWLLLAAFLFTAGTALALWQGGVLRGLIRLARPIHALRAQAEALADMRQSFAVVARGRSALWGAVFDLVAIGLASLGLLLSLRAVGVTHMPWLDTVAIYALGTAAGTLSALPGGLGANEDVSTLVLRHLGVAAGRAAAGTLLFRVVTVLLRTALGWLVLLLARRRLRIQPTPAGLLAAAHGGEAPASAPTR